MPTISSPRMSGANKRRAISGTKANVVQLGVGFLAQVGDLDRLSVRKRARDVRLIECRYAASLSAAINWASMP